jgi:hypothetical protein
MVPEFATVPVTVRPVPVLMLRPSADVDIVRDDRGLEGAVSRVTVKPSLIVAESPATEPGTPLGDQFALTLQSPEAPALQV